MSVDRMEPHGPRALVVLGCKVEPETGALSAALARRTAWALAAYRAGLGEIVVASGGRSWGGHVEADAIAAHLAREGVPEGRIYRELSSLTTAENAFFTAHLLARLGLERATIVTCAWHVPRALACFGRVGLDVRAIDVPTPRAPALSAAYRAVHERVSARLDLWNLSRFTGPRSSRPDHPFDDVNPTR
ncbi:MAG: YdcF family protein [Polyangiaceae bacterium]